MNSHGYTLTLFRLASALILLISLSVAPITQAAGATIYVDASAGGANDGTSWTDAYNDLQDALSAASSGDEIWVAEGVYKPDTSNEDVAFVLVEGVAIYGGFSGGETTRGERNSDPITNNTVLSGEIGDPGLLIDNSNTVVTGANVSSATVLDGFTITAGIANGQKGIPHPDRSGGGMHIDTGSPTLSNLRFLENEASWGGGLFNNKSAPTLTNVSFSGNDADSSGGGMYNKNSDAVLSDVEFFYNLAGDGGGMYNTASDPIMVNITFKGDSATSGGGMYNSNSNPTLTNATFSGETATTFGGALYNDASNPVLTNVSLSGNVAINFGGGLYNLNSNPTIQNAILWINSDSSGSGVAAQIYNAGTSAPTINSSLLGDTDPLFFSDPDNGGDGWDPGDNFGNLRLASASPAIDNGDNSLVPVGITFDLDHNPRIVGGTVDMGAYEAHNIAPVAEDDGYNTDEDTVLDVPASGVLENDHDPNGDNIAVNTYSQPVDGSVTLNTDGSFSYTPDQDFFGTDTFTYTIEDDGTPVMYDWATVTITVTAGTENDPPVAVADAYDALEDATLNVPAPGVLGGPSPDYDPDGDNFEADTNSYTQPANGSVTLNADGSFSYTPNQDFFGQDTFTYRICDDGIPQQCSSNTSVTITVAPGSENDPPVAMDDQFDAVEDTPLNVLDPGVLDNDSDPDGDNYVVDISTYTQPANGLVTLNDDGSFSYTPNHNFFGQDTFTYRICDDGVPQECSPFATVTVTVTAGTENEPPVTMDDQFDAVEDTTLNVPAPGVMFNDSDPDGDNYVVDTNNYTQPANGSVTLNNDGSFSYTPQTHFTGEDTFTYTICDDGTPSMCDIGSVSINVENVTFEIYLPVAVRH